MPSKKKGLDQYQKILIVKPRSKPLVTTILEESKRLESLNRQISKTTKHNIVKYLSDYRKNLSPQIERSQNSTSNYTQIYENVLKRPQALQSLQKENKALSEINTETLDQMHLKNVAKTAEKRFKRLEDVKEISFKPTLWPEESVINNSLYELMAYNEQDRKTIDGFYTNTKAIYGNVRIKSRIGEYTRRYNDNYRRGTAEPGKRPNIARVSTPWTYQSGQNACIFNPYV